MTKLAHGGILKAEVEKLWDKGLPPGCSTGWKSLDAHYTVAPGQLTVVTGWPSSGKSEWLDALLVNLTRQGWTHAVFSFENQPPALHAAKLLEKVTGQPFGAGPNDRIPKDRLAELVQKLSMAFGLFSTSSGGCDLNTILAKAEEWYVSYGTEKRGLVIDPYNELEHRRPNNLSETEYVSQTLSVIRQWARDLGVHVWIVAHPQKMRQLDGKLPIPRPDMISGCHSADTEVLTSRGWVNHAEVTRFDSVACFDHAAGVLRYMRPLKVWAFKHEGEMHRWRSPSYDALVTPNHRMVVRPNWRRKPSVVSRLKLNGTGRPVAYALDEAWNFVESSSVCSDMEMPWATRLADSGQELASIHGMPADAVLKFLGDWISEGWVSGRSGIGVCQAAGDKALAMCRAITEMGVKFTARLDAPTGKGKKTMWKAYIHKSPFTAWVEDECGRGAENKRLPTLVWDLCARQKRILFDALMDGDGCWYGKGGCYTTTSRLLADQVQRIAIELGMMAAVSGRGKAKAHHHEIYTVVIGAESRTHISLRPTRNLSREHYSGMVYCLTVPTGAYLVRRNGKPGIYGNSQHWWNKSDCCITVWRDFESQSQDVDIYIQKVRFKHIGRQGLVTLKYDRVTGRYHEQEPRWTGLSRVV